MYPLRNSEQPYAFNQWYVAAWSHEIGRELFERKILGQSLVLYRTLAGKPVALENACPHRRFALSKGRLDGDTVECAYHGLTFDCAGKCVRVPQQENIPATFVTRSYPVEERWQWIWIWMGDPALADPAKIPDLSWLKVGEAGWLPFVGDVEHVKARYMLLHENLLDLSHLTFLHARNIGSRGVAQAAVEFEVRGDHLALWRDVKSDEFESQPLGKLLGVKGLVDRKMEQQFFPPNLHITGPAFTSAAQGGVNPGHSFGAFRVFHAVTPETPHTCFYFWGGARDFGVDDPALTETMRGFLRHVIAEDVEASETIEDQIVHGGKLSPEISALSDAPGMRGRRLMQALIDADGKSANAA
jgi:vanillate O-demethylase monooxygenase subunit